MPIPQLEGIQHSSIQLNFLANCSFAPFSISLSLSNIFSVVVNNDCIVYEELSSLVNFEIESVLFRNGYIEEPFEKD